MLWFLPLFWLTGNPQTAKTPQAICHFYRPEGSGLYRTEAETIWQSALDPVNIHVQAASLRKLIWGAFSRYLSWPLLLSVTLPEVDTAGELVFGRIPVGTTHDYGRPSEGEGGPTRCPKETSQSTRFGRFWPFDWRTVCSD